MENRGPGFRMPAFSEMSVKGPVPVIVIENVGIPWQTARAAHDGDPFPLTLGGITCGWNLRRIKLDVVANKKVKAPIPVVVEKGAAGTPANLFIMETGFVSDIRKCAVAVVVKQDVVSPEAAEKIIPAVVVVVAHADARLPAGARQTGLFRDIGEGAIAIILYRWEVGACPGGQVVSKRVPFVK